MEKKYVLALDQGTTSSRAIVFDRAGKIISVGQTEFRQIFPQAGWVEHDAEEIWESQLAVAREAVAKGRINAAEIAAIGITNQRETTVVWERATGKPICNAIVWQDRRTADFCNELKRDGTDKIVQAKTGLIVDAYFSATKIRWILDNVSNAREKANRGELCFGTIDAWLLWNLTGGEVRATDVSNASRTMLFNIHSLDWDEELLEIFDVPREILPEIKSSSEIYGETSESLFGAKIPIAGIAGDQQAALFGQACFAEGMAKNTYGTGCFTLMNAGEKPIVAESGLLATVAWQIGDKTTYALEGGVFIAGAAIQWLRDGLKIIENSADIEKLAASVADTDGVYFVPAFVGLGAPHWNQEARGTIVGLTRGSTDAHLALAALESLAFQTTEVLRAMEKDAGVSIKELRVDGGASVNNGLMKFQADVLNAKVVRPVVTETTALGAAYLAGLAVGFWENLEEIKAQWQADREFSPAIEPAEREKLLKNWTRAVNAAKAWADDN